MPDYPDVQIQGGPTSYFSEAEDSLDPTLFEGSYMRPEIRNALVDMLSAFFAERVAGASEWARAWVAGSAVSFQWSAARLPADLDVLIGVDFPGFRSANPQFSGVSDAEIAKILNDDLYENLRQDMWEPIPGSVFELTFYINPDSWDIRAINPYAAYDLFRDEWAVTPSLEGPPDNAYWEEASGRDHRMAQTIVDRYTKSLTALRNASNPAARVNAETALNHAIDQGVRLFDDIHGGRRSAFSRVGAGYADWGNYRWQAGKRSGTVPALKALKTYRNEVTKSGQAQTYGLELPDSETLVRRAVSRRIEP